MRHWIVPRRRLSLGRAGDTDCCVRIAGGRVRRMKPRPMPFLRQTKKRLRSRRSGSQMPVPRPLQPLSLPQPAPQLNTETADLESGRADVYGPIVVAASKPAAPARKPAVTQAPDQRPHPHLPQRPKPKCRRNGRPASMTAIASSTLSCSSRSPRNRRRCIFGTHAIGFGQGGMQPWERDEVPTVLAAPHVDPEIKRAAARSVTRCHDRCGGVG